MKKVAVILSGCGVQDGSEIHEAVLTLLALDQEGAQVICTSLDKPQYHVVNHQNGKIEEDCSRNVLNESARIARHSIQSLDQLNPQSVDAIILPGGYGAAKNLSSFATAGRDFQIDPTLARFLSEAKRLGKPMGFICIAPAIAAKLFGSEKIKFTIGNDADTASVLETFGALHMNCAVDQIVVDAQHRIVTTPAYMLAQRISEAYAGITKLVEKVLELSDR